MFNIPYDITFCDREMTGNPWFIRRFQIKYLVSSRIIWSKILCAISADEKLGKLAPGQSGYIIGGDIYIGFFNKLNAADKKRLDDLMKTLLKELEKKYNA